MNRFHSMWEAKAIKQEVVASGLWYYQDKIPYEATLLKQLWNYGSEDLPELDAILEAPFCDYINFNISDEGVLYYWQFSGSSGNSSSPAFATYFQARDHINTYGYSYDINW